MVEISREDQDRIKFALAKLMVYVPPEYKDEAGPLLAESLKGIMATMGADKVDEFVADLESLKVAMERQDAETMTVLGTKYGIPGPYLAVMAAMLIQGIPVPDSEIDNSLDQLAHDVEEFSGERE